MTCQRISHSFVRFCIVVVGIFALADSVYGQDKTPGFTYFLDTHEDYSANSYIPWLGGDIPQGRRLGTNYSFWGFSDTYLTFQGSGRADKLVSNTVAIGVVNGGQFNPYYFCKGTASDPKAFFPDPAPNYNFWIGQSFVAKGVLFVFLNVRYHGDEIKNDPALGGDLGDGEYLGTFIARIINPADNPISWNIDYLYMYTTGPGTTCPIYVGREAIVTPDEAFVDIYSTYNPTNNLADYSDIILRLSVAGLILAEADKPIDKSIVSHAVPDLNNVVRWESDYAQFQDDGHPDYFDAHITPVTFSLRLQGDCTVNYSPNSTL